MTDAQAAVMRELRDGGVLKVGFGETVVVPIDEQQPRWITWRQTAESLIRKHWVSLFDTNEELEGRYVISALGIEAADREFGKNEERHG